MKRNVMINLKHLLIFLLPAILISCGKEDPLTPAVELTINQTVVNEAEFSLLETAVTRAGLEGYLENTNNLTVFAPRNIALTNANYPEAAILAAAPADLGKIIKYHVLTTRLTTATLPNGPNAEVTTALGEKAYITKTGTSVFINGVLVTTADIGTKNGVIHAVNTLLVPPVGNITATLPVLPDLNYFTTAILRANNSGTNVTAALSVAGPLTIFAPTNQAFIDAGYPTLASINSADPNTLKNIILYHVIASRTFSNDLVNNSTPATLQGGMVAITTTGGAKVKGNGNATASTITRANIVATNGVVHVIDRLLIP